MEFRNLSCSEFTEILSSKAPAPGGGGASALVGAIGISLGNMVGELTVGKKKYAENEPRIRELMAQSEKLRQRLLILIDKDAEDFIPLSKAYLLPKDAENRDEIMEECLRKAIETPLEIFDISCECIEILKEYAEKGSRLMISDAATGAAVAEASLKGAAVNVRVNTRLMKDRAFAEKTDTFISENLEKYSKTAETVYEYVCNILS